jgi:leucyl aminopeptidase
VNIQAAVVDARSVRDSTGDDEVLPFWLVDEPGLADWLASQAPATARWVRSQRFAAEAQRVLLLPRADGGVAGALAGLGPRAALGELVPWQVAALPERLPPRLWRIAQELPTRAATALVVGWLHGSYRFTAYRATSAAPVPEVARLVATQAAELAYAVAAAIATSRARDLINTPASDLGPEELAAAVASVGREHGARVTQVVGAALLEQGFRLIHAVGRASAREPRLVELRWGDASAPAVTLVGKGVCFDSGGLDLKASAGMLLMKKDMGGAASALATAELLMAMKAPVNLRLLVPAVENSVAGNAFRPGDVLRSHKGLSVEIGNTDAEGRLVLADALSLADQDDPALMLDFATLTGAARVALGPELPAAFANDAQLLQQIARCGELECDPAWPMPLWNGYDDELGSRIADVANVSSSGFAGAVMAALFLRRFVTRCPHWAHFDLYAWNARERPGRPVGAEAQCVRLAYRLVRERCG